MNQYVEKAIKTYLDPSQTIVAKQIAHSVLVNAGFTEDDIQNIKSNRSTNRLDSFEVTVFLA